MIQPRTVFTLAEEETSGKKSKEEERKAWRLSAVSPYKNREEEEE
jgi:hypothetical protein